MLILINQWLLNLIFHTTKTLNGQGSYKQISTLLSTFQCFLENPDSIIFCIPLFALPFLF